MKDVKAAHRKLTARVMGRPGVAGTAIGERKGAPCLLVYVDSPESGRSLPDSVDGVPVAVEVTGQFRKR